MVFYTTSLVLRMMEYEIGELFWPSLSENNTIGYFLFVFLFEKERRNLVIGRAGNALLSSVCFSHS